MSLEIRKLIRQTIDRIKELDVAIQRAITLKDRNLVHILKDTRRNNYLLYKVITGEVYPHEEERIQ